MKIGIISLGCAKNRVDAENMLGLLTQAGHEITNDASEADIILINTCGFIQSAKQEAIDAIFEMDSLRKEGAKILVSGCLAQRYHEEILAEMPEVDGLLGIGAIGDIARYVGKLASGERIVDAGRPYRFFDAPRLLTTEPHAVYLKVADGCDNRCAYCAIPGIRGKYISRTLEDVLGEANNLIGAGAKEISLIAQDTTRYGLDLYGRPKLKELLKRLCAIKADVWWRCLYLYPEMIDEELLDIMAESPQICPYIDVPIQHINEEILTRMNRRGGRAAIERMYALARARGFTLRTTVLVGFPGEGQNQFEELMSFLRDHPFDRLGAFAYSKEEGTPAASMPGQVAARTKQTRERLIMEQQEGISGRLLEKRIGENCRILITQSTKDEAGRPLILARSQCEAPEIDGMIILPADGARSPGDWADARVTASAEHDLWGELT